MLDAAPPVRISADAKCNHISIANAGLAGNRPTYLPCLFSRHDLGSFRLCECGAGLIERGGVLGDQIAKTLQDRCIFVTLER